MRLSSASWSVCDYSRSPLKELHRNKTESLFDIEIMTPQGTEKKRLVTLDGVENCEHKAQQTRGTCGTNLISQNAIFEM